MLLVLTRALKSISSTQPSAGLLSLGKATLGCAVFLGGMESGDRRPGEGSVKWKMAGDSGGVAGDSVALGDGGRAILVRKTALRATACKALRR